MNIKLYTDGACSGNPGPGGYGFILSTVLENGQLYEKQGSRGFRHTTNNRMELSAVIEGLRMIKGRHDVEVITDSKYVCDAINKNWAIKWKLDNWYNSSGRVKNRGLWMQLLDLIDTQNSVKFTWVKGHNGHKYNEMCDRLAVNAYNNSANYYIDAEFESGCNN